ncbi:MAG: phosphodiesterase [Alphaproteobacteria bacterium]|nr:phosphodiesterase [Alphaproteobacteria bacterium]
MMKLIHLTDPHLVPPGKTLYGGDPQAVLAEAAADINRRHADADLVVMTGDLTHWGEPETFESLKQTLAPLTPPLQLLIGNHDHRETFAACFPNHPRDANGFIQARRKTPAGHMIFLDTVLEGTHAGWYCTMRRTWLAERLEEAEEEGADVFLFMHHPPFDIGLKHLDQMGLNERSAFWSVLAPHRARIRHLFFGHVHRPVMGSWRGIPVSSIRGLNHQCWLDFDDPDTAWGSFEPPAYAVVLIDAERVMVHPHDFKDDSAKFRLDDSPVDDWANAYAEA